MRSSKTLIMHFEVPGVDTRVRNRAKASSLTHSSLPRQHPFPDRLSLSALPPMQSRQEAALPDPSLRQPQQEDDDERRADRQLGEEVEPLECDHAFGGPRSNEMEEPRGELTDARAEELRHTRAEHRTCGKTL